MPAFDPAPFSVLLTPLLDKAFAYMALPNARVSLSISRINAPYDRSVATVQASAAPSSQHQRLEALAGERAMDALLLELRRWIDATPHPLFHDFHLHLSFTPMRKTDGVACDISVCNHHIATMSSAPGVAHALTTLFTRAAALPMGEGRVFVVHPPKGGGGQTQFPAHSPAAAAALYLLLHHRGNLPKSVEALPVMEVCAPDTYAPQMHALLDAVRAAPTPKKP